MELEEEFPSSYFDWKVNEESVSAKNTERYAYTGFSSLVIYGGSSVKGDVILSLDNTSGHPVSGPKTFNFIEQSSNELIYVDSNDDRWSTTNAGGSGELKIDSYKVYNDQTFSNAYIEGTFSGTLTRAGSDDVLIIKDGAFGVSER